MLKRFLSLVICLTVIFGSFVFAENAGENAIAADIDFGDRILYGGTAVDIGSDTVYSENGSLFKIGANGEKKIRKPREETSQLTDQMECCRMRTNIHKEETYHE